MTDLGITLIIGAAIITGLGVLGGYDGFGVGLVGLAALVALTFPGQGQPCLRRRPRGTLR